MSRMKDLKNKLIKQSDGSSNPNTLVFRQSLDRILDANRTESPKLNAEQESKQQRLQEAAIYAKSTLLNDEARAEYEAKSAELRTSYTIAIADFLQAPHIEEIDLSDYEGQVGDTIRVQVTDDFKVASVSVSIVHADGTVLEKGNASQQGASNDWLYKATATNNSLDGDKILIQASDLPGNVTHEEHPVAHK